MMSQNKDRRQDRRQDRQEEQEPFVPSSPVKRTMAWIGLVYAFLLLGMITYIFYTGTALGNLAPMLALPGLIGLGVLAIVSWRTAGKPGALSAILLAALCFGLAAFTAPLAWAGLMSNFGG